MEYLREFVLSRWGSTFVRIQPGSDPRTREIEGWFDDRTVYVRSTLIQTACGRTLKKQHIGRLLAEKGLLAENEPGRHTVRYVPGVGNVRCYAIKRSFFGKPVL